MKPRGQLLLRVTESGNHYRVKLRVSRRLLSYLESTAVFYEVITASPPAGGGGGGGYRFNEVRNRV